MSQQHVCESTHTLFDVTKGWFPELFFQLIGARVTLDNVGKLNFASFVTFSAEGSHSKHF